MAAHRPLIAGNWKMYGRTVDLAEIAKLAHTLSERAGGVEALICPPAPYISGARASAGAHLAIGGQDCSPLQQDSARTGEYSAAMLADLGATYVIVGHSERRTQHGESDAVVRQKAEAALAAGLIPIICVGETLAERDAGRVAEVVGAQVEKSTPETSAHVAVAYEPVWAIGGTTTPTLAEIAEVHILIKAVLERRSSGAPKGLRVLYGGSVAPKNARDIFSVEGVDGALVGRASLKAADFEAIISSHPAAG